MSIKGAAVTVKCDGRGGGCRNFLEIDLDIHHHEGSRSCSLGDTDYCEVHPVDIGSAVEKEGWGVFWGDNMLHFCKDHSEDLDNAIDARLARERVHRG